MQNNYKLFSIVMVLTILFSSIGTAPALAAPAKAPSTNLSQFASCIVADVKLLPQAKKLTPQGYQNIEKIINTTNTAAGYIKLGQNASAVFLGVKIGGFIGWNLIWYIGMVQDCWGQLKR